ncbi:proline-rich proteoglycan 2-like, partial [Mirounga angustirostris]
RPDPARTFSSSSRRDREHFAWGRPPPKKAIAARGGDDTQTSGEAGFGPERADRGHKRAFRHPVEARAAGVRRRRRGGGESTAGEGRERVRGRAGSGKGAPTKTQAGPPGKRARDPTATSTRAVPRRPGRQPASAPLAHLTTNRAPHCWGPTPREPPPPRGPVLNLRLSGPSRKSRPWGEAPPGESGPTRARHATASGDSGRERAGRQPLARHGEAGRAGAPPEPLERQRHEEGRPPARSHARGSPHAPDAGQARRDPPPTRRGEAQAAVGKERRSAPTAGPAESDPSQRGSSAQHATVVTPHRWPLRAEEGRRLGGSGTPRHPLGSLEKAFSPRAHRPHPNRAPPPVRAPRNGVPKA